MNSSRSALQPLPPLGLIAGNGQLPLLVARGAKAAGRRVVAVGLRDQFDLALPALCDEFSQAGWLRIGKWIRLLRRAGVHDAVMVGGVSKQRMHDPFKLIRQLPDLRALRLWYRRLRHDRRNAAVLAAVADELASSGVTLMDSTTYIQEHLATLGVMGSITPSSAQQADIAFGWPIISQVCELDVGQAIAVRDRDTIAVEAVEGTDAMIDRASTLCRSRGWTLLKTSSGNHDRRADVPTVGVATIERLAKAGGTCLALGVGRVILIEKPAVIAAANRLGVAVVGVA
ncbi:MAG: LpxI family protein [Phycisphaerales bacterium]|nr:LpxI family protein [Phycisphaerales bacterium]